jgi:ABC-type glycerol-3-phosphate transport system permease component
MPSAESNLANTRTSSHVTKPHRRRFHWRTVLMHSIIIFFCMIVLVPLLWVMLMSVKSLRDAYTGTLWPDQFDFTHYRYVFQKMPSVLRNFSNSIIVTLSWWA